MTNWHKVEDLYIVCNKKIANVPKKKAIIDWVGIDCVYKIKVNNKVVHVGRSDTCKKHGPAEKVRKAIVQLLGLEPYNPSVTPTKLWREIRLKYRPNSSNISIEVIETNAIAKTYLQESI